MLVTGIGNGLSCVGYLIIAHYFKQRRGLANACLVAGAGLGHFVSPLVIGLLQEEYGVWGATIILGGITLHAVVGAFLFQPVEWHWKKPEKEVATEDTEAFSSLLDSHTKAGEPKREAVKVASSDTGEGDDAISKVSMPMHVSQSTKVEDRDGTRSSVYLLVPLAKTKPTAGPPAAWRDRGRGHANALCRTMVRVLRSVASDMRILRQPTCLIIALGSALVVNAEANFLVMVPFAIQAAGHPLQTAAWCVSIAGVCNLFTRISVSALSDLPWFNMRLSYMAGMAVMIVSVIGKCNLFLHQ